MTLQHLRSSTANKRPDPTAMADGQIALNTAAASPGLFYKDSAGNLVKAGPVHVGSTAPNVSPASGGTAGNSTGESWLDTSGSNPLLKIWSGAAWQTVQPVASGTVVSTADTGSVTSTMIADGTIVNADVNASAAIAGTKISPDFGAQNVTTTGTSTAASFIPTSSTVPTNGVYLPAANSVAISTGGTQKLAIDSSGNVSLTGPNLSIGGTAPSNAGYSNLYVNNTSGAQLFLSVNGSNSRVIYSTATDLNYYISNSSPHIWFTNAAERMRLDSSGRLGVGTNSPSSLFHLSGNSGTAVFTLSDPANGMTGRLTADPTTLSLGTTTNHAVVCYTNSAERLRIDTSGRVGIGTSSPGSALDLRGSTSASLFIGRTSNAGSGSEPGYIDFRGPNASSNDRSWVQIKSIVDNATQGSEASQLGFLTQTAGNLTEKIRIDGSGRVGIGTTSASATLHVSGSGAPLILNCTSANSNNIIFQINGSARGYIGPAGNLGGSDNDMGYRVESGNNQVFYVGSSEAARIDSSRRFLVGTSSAFTASTGNAPYGKFATVGATNDATAQGIIALGKGAAASSNLGASAVLGEIYFTDNAGNPFAVITGSADAATGANDYPGRLTFSTTADGASSPTERVRIKNNGDVTFGTTGSSDPIADGIDATAIPAGANSFRINRLGQAALSLGRGASNGDIADFYRTTTKVGSISVTTTATAYNTSSDYRLKENVIDLNGAIDRLKQLPVHRFNFIADPDTVVDGFIAHEAAEVVPEAVTGAKDEVDADGNPIYQGIDQSKLVPLLTAALQESIKRIEQLEATVTALQQS